MFMEMKGKSAPKIKNNDWNRDLAFPVNIASLLNELNQKLQTQNQLVHELYSHIKAFKSKLSFGKDS